MSQTLAQKTNPQGFPKPGELIEITGAHELKLTDRMIMDLLYQYAHDSGLIEKVGAEWDIPMHVLRSSLHESNDHIRGCLKRLLKIVVNVPSPSAKTGEPRLVMTHLFDFFDVSVDEGSKSATVRFGLPKKLQPILASSNHWGRIKAETVLSISSKYSLALYELVQLRGNLEISCQKFSLERFREMMSVPPGKLLLGRDFERRVIEPALLEVNALSDFITDIQMIRKHPRAPITEVRVAWRKRGADEYRAQMAEEKRPKKGRLVRLRAAAKEAPVRKKLTLPD